LEIQRGAPVAFVQDAVTVAPQQSKVRAENDKVRVLEYTSKRGVRQPHEGCEA
jgi:hypothetical protein